MELEVHVDRRRCIGSGECVRLAPGVFDQDDQAISIVVDPRGEPEERIVHTMSACPVGAITLLLDGVPIGADDIKDWMRGIDSADPIVPVLEQLGEEHHELLDLITSSDAGEPAGRVEKVRSLAGTHLRNEAEVYSSLVPLVPPRLVDTFEGGHARIGRALHLAAQESDLGGRGPAMSDLARAVTDQIRLEETLLFPVVLAALAKGARLAPRR
jgi:ferredoxin